MNRSGDFWREAFNTIKADGWTLLLARMFGRREVVHDKSLGRYVLLRHWRGRAYMFDRVESTTKDG